MCLECIIREGGHLADSFTVGNQAEDSERGGTWTDLSPREETRAWKLEA